MDVLKAIRDLCGAVGVSGYEEAASQVAYSYLQRFTDKTRIDDFYNVVGIVRAPEQGEKTVLLDAHIDQIGMIVTYLDDKGFLRVTGCGGMDRRLLLGQQVTVHGRKPIKGVIATIPPHLSTAADSQKVPEMEDILIDIGMSAEKAGEVVSLGDYVTIDSPIVPLLGSRVSAKALDDRIGVIAILRALELIKGKDLHCGVEVLFSCQEETGKKGAIIEGFDLEPDIAVAVDVGFALTPDASPYQCGRMGAGAMIEISPILSKSISDQLCSLAEEGEIPYQLSVNGGRTGTNADVLGTVKGGIQTGCISIPLKYMHTPIEVVDLDDVESVAQLLAAYLLSFGEEC